jgi:hypothetical protein
MIFEDPEAVYIRIQSMNIRIRISAYEIQGDNSEINDKKRNKEQESNFSFT